MEKADAQFVAALRREHTAVLRNILGSNDDLFERVRKAGIVEDYDREGDILYLWLGGPQPASSESVDGLLYLRVDPESSRIVGIELEHAREIVREAPFISKFVHDLLIAGRRDPPPEEWMPFVLQQDIKALAEAV